MELLPGWGPPTWSPAPSTALNLVSPVNLVCPLGPFLSPRCAQLCPSFPVSALGCAPVPSTYQTLPQLPSYLGCPSPAHAVPWSQAGKPFSTTGTPHWQPPFRAESQGPAIGWEPGRG